MVCVFEVVVSVAVLFVVVSVAVAGCEFEESATLVAVVGAAAASGTGAVLTWAGGVVTTGITETCDMKFIGFSITSSSDREDISWLGNEKGNTYS